MLTCERFVLPNNLRVLITPLPQRTTIATLILVRGGARTEHKEKMGISHFMEHMFFKGGKKYPNPLSLATEIDKVGADSNAATGKEEVVYYLKHPASCPLLGLDILEDMIMHATFPDFELIPERKTVEEELNRTLDNPQQMLLSYGRAHLFFGDHPLGWEILGPRETIRGFTRDDLITYQNTFFKADNMIISVAGNVNVGQTLQEIEKRFGSLPSGKAPEWLAFDVTSIPQERVWLLPKKEKEAANIMIAAAGPGYQDPDYYPSLLLIALLGGCSSSRINQEVREKRGLAYALHSFISSNQEIGTFISYLETANESIEEAITLVLNEYKTITQHLVPTDELEKTKGLCIGGIEMALENTDFIAQQFGTHELRRGKTWLLSKLIETIRAITTENILRVAQKYMTPENIKIGMVAKEEFCNQTKLEQLLESAS